MFDYLIQNGQLIDGTGAPAVCADIAITDGKIAAVGDLKDASAGTVIDAAGKYVTPGFIDIHRHADAAVFRPGFGELELKPGELGLIVNRAPMGQLDDGVRQEIEKHGLKLLGVLPQDEAVYRCDCAGEPSAKLPDSNPVKTALRGILEHLAL